MASGSLHAHGLDNDGWLVVVAGVSNVVIIRTSLFGCVNGNANISILQRTYLLRGALPWHLAPAPYSCSPTYTHTRPRQRCVASSSSPE